MKIINDFKYNCPNCKESFFFSKVCWSLYGFDNKSKDYKLFNRHYFCPFCGYEIDKEDMNSITYLTYVIVLFFYPFTFGWPNLLEPFKIYVITIGYLFFFLHLRVYILKTNVKKKPKRSKGSGSK